MQQVYLMLVVCQHHQGCYDWCWYEYQSCLQLYIWFGHDYWAAHNHQSLLPSWSDLQLYRQYIDPPHQE